MSQDRYDYKDDKERESMEPIFEQVSFDSSLHCRSTHGSKQ